LHDKAADQARRPCIERRILALRWQLGQPGARARKTALERLTQGRGTVANRMRNGRRFGRGAVVLVVIWSLVEIPVELDVSRGGVEIAALLFSKAMVVIIGFGATLGTRCASRVFAFICGMSLLAVVPALFFEMKTSPVDFFYSFVECILKALAFVTFVCGAGGGGSSRIENGEV
jgi:hypothetical protein